MTNTEANYFNTDGAKLAYDYFCAQENPNHLLVLVNGYQRTRQDFRSFRKKSSLLAPHVATLALDNRYCGDTTVLTNEPLTITQMARDVLDLTQHYLQKTGLKSFSLLGISMGGMIAQTLSATVSPGLLDNLFLVSTTSGGVGRTWPRVVSDPTKLEYENKNVELESSKKNMHRYFGEKFLKNSPLLFEMMCKNIFKNAQAQGDDQGAKMQFTPSAQFDGVANLTKISAKKTVIFTGDEDYVIPLQNAYYLNEHIKNSQLIVYPKVGHLILIEEPEKFVHDVATNL